MASRTIVIRKYGNRRLYDITNSRYVNLDEVAHMVRDGRDVQVVDAVTNDDLTRAVLTQIIVEQARDEDSVLPLDILRQMVAVSGKASSETALTYMKAVFDMYQNAYRTVAAPALGVTPRASAPPAAAAPVPDEEMSVEALRRRVRDLESSVSRLKAKAAPPPRKRAAKSRREKR